MIIIWLDQARDSLRKQIMHIAIDNPGAAIDQRDLVMHRVNSLEEHPLQGRPGRKAKTHELVVSKTPFVVIYKVKPRKGRIEILRVLHGAQQWPPKRKS